MSNLLHCCVGKTQNLAHKNRFTIIVNKIIQVRNSYAPWMSSEMREMIKQRDAAQKKAVETQNNDDWEYYKKIRNSLNNIQKQEKKNWQEKKLESFGNDTGSVWKNIKSWLGWSSGGSPTRLVHNGSVFTKPKDLSRIMNEYFVNKVKILRDNLPASPGDPLTLVRRLMRNRKCSMKLKPVHPDQVLRIISNMKTSSSCGLDTIDSGLLKIAKFQLTPVITHLVNLSIKNRRFPRLWKVSKVVPLHKKEEKIYPKNYRPVSLLPVLSKVLERAIFQQFSCYLEENHLLHPSHHGFRAGRSTATALIEMYDQWIEAFERNEVTAVVMLDLSAAFDVVDHDILIQKMELYGFEDCAITWLSSYLSDRKQRVYVEGSLSEPLQLEAGVPQGSILGPLLYIIYSNDLPEIVHSHEQLQPQVEHNDQEADQDQHEDQPQHQEGHHDQVAVQVQHEDQPQPQVAQHEDQEALSHKYNLNCNDCGGICMFADDSTFSMSHKNTDQLKEAIKEKYEKIKNYMSKNKLILNDEKNTLTSDDISKESSKPSGL